MLDLTVIILTFNEEKHIERCIKSVLNIASEVIIIDSYSVDRTVDIATKLGARVIQNPFSNHAKQLNFGLDTANITTEWVMKMDADEYLSEELCSEVNNMAIDPNVNGLYVKRRVYFLDKWIKHGGYYPTWLLRIWRNGQGRSEQKLMDEHIILAKPVTQRLKHDIIDENFNNLTWWTEKHNHYASKEAVELLNEEYDLLNRQSLVLPRLFGTQEQRKRFLKQKYANLPLFIRPFFYFIYRYFFKLGFLDGKAGFIWHFLQGFWYRFLVDAKIFDIKRRAENSKGDIVTALRDEYGVTLED